MEIRIRETGQIISDIEFRAMHPNTSFPEILNQDIVGSLGADVVLEGPYPIYTRTQLVIRDGVIQIDGKWHTNYKVIDKDEEMLLMDLNTTSNLIRNMRNQKLSACDWTQLSDSPINKEAWAVYRQALRDITSQEGFPFNITWPDEPV